MFKLVYFAPIAAALALLFALYKAQYVKNATPGTERMVEIAQAIAEGANAFLKSEYKYVRNVLPHILPGSAH